MGNRAIVIFTHPYDEVQMVYSPAVYLQWNGGPESIYQFLDEMEKRIVLYGNSKVEAASFIGIVADFFGAITPDSACHVRVSNGPTTETDLGQYDYGDDNGLYLIQRIRGEKPYVKRFVGFTRPDWNVIPFREISAEGVERERIKAYEDPYNNWMPEYFDLVRKYRRVANAQHKKHMAWKNKNKGGSLEFWQRHICREDEQQTELIERLKA